MPRLASTPETERPTALLLHSGGLSGRQWRPLAARLAATHDVLAPDFLGCGARAPWTDDPDFHFQRDVEEVAKALGQRGAPVHVAGHSYGGLVALTLAREHSLRVTRVAVYEPVAFGVLHGPPDPEGLADLAAAETPASRDEVLGGGELWLEGFVDYWNGRGAWAVLSASARAGLLGTGREAFREVLSLLADRTPARAYASLSASLLVMRGESSPAAARRVAEILAANVPRARLDVVRGAGHMGPISHATTVTERIVEHFTAPA